MTTDIDLARRESVLAGLGAQSFAVIEHGSSARATKNTALLLGAVLGVMGAGLAKAEDTPNRFQAQIDEIHHDRSVRREAVQKSNGITGTVGSLVSAPISTSIRWAAKKIIRAQLANGSLDSNGVAGHMMGEIDQIEKESDWTSKQFVEPTPGSVAYDAGFGLLTSAAFPPATVYMVYNAARDGYEIVVSRSERQLEDRLRKASARIDAIEGSFRDEALGRESQARMGLKGRAFEISQEIQITLAMKHLMVTGEESEVVEYQRQQDTADAAEPWLAEYDRQADLYVNREPVEAPEVAQLGQVNSLGRNALITGLSRMSEAKDASDVENPSSRGAPSITMR